MSHSSAAKIRMAQPLVEEFGVCRESRYSVIALTKSVAE